MDVCLLYSRQLFFFQCVVFRAGICLSFPNIWSLAKKFSECSSEISALSPSVHRHLVEALMRACTHVTDKETQHQLQNQVSDNGHYFEL